MVKFRTHSSAAGGLPDRLRAVAYRIALSAGCVVLASTPAAAELGGSRATIDGDRAHLAAALHSANASTHILHTLTTSNGSVVREFANSGGVVFAVAWRGPGRPDLRQLLGAAFGTFQATAAGPDANTTVASDGSVVRHGRLRRALTVEQRDLVVHSAGHPGAFFGYAYLPQQIPAGFTPDALR